FPRWLARAARGLPGDGVGSVVARLARHAEFWLAVPQGVRARVHVPVVPRHLPALPLRPDHAPRLEGADPGDAGMDRGGDDHGRVSHRAVGATLVPLKGTYPWRSTR